MNKKPAPIFKQSLLASLVLLAMHSAHAGVVRDDIDYQQFRDFAENKGKFAVGKTEIAIKNKKGEVVETILKDIPMPDWSAVNKEGYATLIDPQYVVSVTHNCCYEDVQFGSNNNQNPDNQKFNYKLVERNRFRLTDLDARNDYHHPRLHKLVTEVNPIETINLTKLNTEAELKTFNENYPLLFRIGSGIQKTITPEGVEREVAGGYYFLTGGILPVATLPPDGSENVLAVNKDVNGENKSQMSISTLSGDSGSPVYAYDATSKKWKLVSVHVGPNNGNLYSSLYKADFSKKERDKHLKEIKTTNEILTWKPDHQNGASQINFGNQNLSVNILNPKLAEYETDVGGGHPRRPRENYGETLIINGENNTLHLTDSINQGAGAIHFEGNTTVTGATNDVTWLGAGIVVKHGKIVNWKIKNPKDDRLSKIGEGVLIVDGQGNNEGSISVGDGFVYLNQNGGYAFHEVDITSGRPTVKLANSEQVIADNIRFGYRGGRLDVNGNDLSFSYIKNVDDGAIIANYNSGKSATVTITANAVDEYKAAFNGFFGETEPSKTNGELTVVYNPNNPQTDKTFLMSGGMNLKGDLIVKNGNLQLSGRPAPHAYDHIKKVEPFQDNDWISRDFNAENVNVENDAKLTVGRNVTALTGNLNLGENATAELGFVNGSTPVCVRSDYFGTTSCQTKNYSDDVLKTIPETKITGDINLQGKSNTTIGKAHWTGKSTIDANANTAKDSTLTLAQNAKWTMTGNSNLGNLAMNKDSEITLNQNYESGNTSNFNTLTIHGDLSGGGQFNYLTNFNDSKGDKVDVKGKASGNFKFGVKNTGTEPDPKNLVLLEAGQVDANFKAKLKSISSNNNHVDDNDTEYVDLGAWRYSLKQANNQVFLQGLNSSSTGGTNTGGTNTGGTNTGGTNTGGTNTGGTNTGGTNTGGTNTGGTNTGGTNTGGTNTGGTNTGGTNTVAQIRVAQIRGGTNTGGTNTGGTNTGGTNTGGTNTGGTNTGGTNTGGTNTGGTNTGGTNTGGTNTGGTNTGGTNTGGTNTGGTNTGGTNTGGTNTGGTNTGGTNTGGTNTGGTNTGGTNTGGTNTGGTNTGGTNTGGTNTGGTNTGGTNTGGTNTGGTNTNSNANNTYNPTPVITAPTPSITPVVTIGSTPSTTSIAPTPVTSIAPTPVTSIAPTPVTSVAPTTNPLPAIPFNQMISKYTNMALSAEVANLESMFRSGALDGRLQNVKPEQTGVWLNINYGEYNRISDYHRPYNDKQDLVQVGVDGDTKLDKGILILGLALSDAKGSQKFDEGTGESRLTAGHLYGKYLFDNGVFVGADTGYGRVRQKLTMDKKTDYAQTFADVGVSTGKTFEFDKFYIEPSASIHYYKALDSKTYNLDGASVQLQDFYVTTYQPSVKLSYNHQASNGVTISPYVSSTYNHWSGKPDLTVNGYQFVAPFANNWQHKIGLETQKGQLSGQLYATYDKGKTSSDGHSVGLMVNYRW